ncbi:heme peroxidase [Corynespora cassiicola Philippines]|uniref:Heme peroxidase n=1 Tax=Corynespora cassiicola Philippines TaxID=1448308 RepID=A0A2T2P2A1_CORCC|nr:heme peroxidase [Corynespora cassiicola Philippines]
MGWTTPALAGLLLVCQQYRVAAQPTWPASTDDLEDILLLNSGYRARGFADGVTPCSKGLGPGRNTAAEWVRTAFHDMATANTYQGTGGLDGSIAFETSNGENVGAAFPSSLNTYAPFFSSRTSLADIIAAGVYTATRACGGPIVPVRGGRIDATTNGALGVPVPQNPIGTFRNQFLRTGYNSTEMIEFVACGHTLGGVHAADFPDVIDPGTHPDDFATLDTTVGTFDNKVVTEYLDGTTQNPLVVGKSVGTRRNSDFVVFSSGNATMRTLADAQNFANRCSIMFQRMIEVVPAGVTLTDVIVPYEVKPYDLQLTLLGGGTKLRFTGDIRIRTTQRSSIAAVQLAYKDRTGATVSTPINTDPTGTASGFDDTFAFFGFDTELPADTSISSFNVIIQLASGTTETQNNNGNGFKVDDTIIYQAPQSCLDGSGKLTAVAAVRGGATAPNLRVVVKNPRASPVVVPSLSTANVAMATQSAVGSYQLYSGSYTFSGSQAQSALFGVIVGSASDNFKNATVLPTSCQALGSSEPTPTSSTNYRFQGCYYDAGAPRALAAAATSAADLTIEKCAAFCSTYQYFGLEYSRECYCGNTLDATSTIRALSDCNMACAGNSAQTCGAGNRISLYSNTGYSAPSVTQVPGYNYSGCYSEGTTQRALMDDATASDTMSVQNCATFCDGSKYFGVEYGRECYCGETLSEGAVQQSESDCNMLCAGNSTQFCGAGSRLNLFEKLAASSSTPTPTPTPTPSSSVVSSSSSGFVTSTTVQQSSSTPGSSSSSSAPVSSSTSSSTPTPTPSSTSTPQPSSSSTSETPSPTPSPDVTSSSVASSSTPSPSSSTTSSTPTPTPTGPSFPGYNYTGCITDRVDSRSLTAKSQAVDTNSWATCAQFCDGYQYFGVEYGRECYCGDRLLSDPETRPDSECTMTCSGNSTQVCGDAGRLTVFKSLTVITPPGNPMITGYNYTGCYTDSVSARVLTDNFLFDGSAMTISKCAEFCNGSKYFGTEYGSECYCGAQFSAATQSVAQSDCSFVCSGDRTEFCGAGDRLTLYEKL